MDGAWRERAACGERRIRTWKQTAEKKKSPHYMGTPCIHTHDDSEARERKEQLGHHHTHTSRCTTTTSPTRYLPTGRLPNWVGAS